MAPSRRGGSCGWWSRARSFQLPETPLPDPFFPGFSESCGGVGCVLRRGVRVVLGRCWLGLCVGRRNKPFLPSNERWVNSFLWSVWMTELAMGPRRRIRAGPREDKLQPATGTVFLSVEIAAVLLPVGLVQRSGDSGWGTWHCCDLSGFLRSPGRLPSRHTPLIALRIIRL